MLFQPSPINDDEPLSTLLSSVPTLPTRVTMLSGETGEVDVLLADVDRGKLIGYGPQSLMQDGIELVLPVRDSSGGGHDFTLRVDRAYYQVNQQTMLNLSVAGMELRAGHREAPRYRLDDSGVVCVIESDALDPQTFQVWMADLSETGAAFLTELNCSVNDTILLTISLGERPVTLEARVRRVDAAPLRNRVAAEITSIRDWDRAAITRLADEHGTPDEPDRQPEIAAARAQYRAEQHQLQVRMALRRYGER